MKRLIPTLSTSFFLFASSLMLVAQSPASVDQYMMARDQFFAAKYKSSVVYLEILLKQEPQYENAARLLAQCYEMLEMREKAAGAYEKVLAINPRDKKACFNLSLIHLEQKDYKNAEIRLRQAVQIDPRYDKALVKLGKLQEMKAEYAQANKLYERASVRNYEQCDLAYKKARNYFERNDFKNAIETLKPILTKTNDPRVSYLAGYCYDQLGNRNGAITMYEKATMEDDKFIDAWVNMGILYYNQKDFSLAVEKFSIAIDLEPDNTKILTALGFALYNLNEYDDARKYLQTSLKHDPSNARANYFLALVYKKMGNKDRADHYVALAKKHGYRTRIAASDD